MGVAQLSARRQVSAPDQDASIQAGSRQL